MSSWRSGSTFLGDVLNSMPANYYHYEPLLNYDIVQIRGPPQSDTAITALKQLFRCNYTPLTDCLNYAKKVEYNYQFRYNTRLWNACQANPSFCYEPNFLSRFCRLFPFQSMKLVRLRLSLAEALLTDAELNVKIVLLVRDPRAIMQSRKHHVWCPKSKFNTKRSENNFYTKIIFLRSLACLCPISLISLCKVEVIQL